jgi:hypothetical protein
MARALRGSGLAGDVRHELAVGAVVRLILLGVLNESTLAKEGRATEYAVIYGDCILTGPPEHGESTAVDPKLVDYFSMLELSPNAVADWDTREVNWRVTSWDLDRDRGDDGYGLGL